MSTPLDYRQLLSEERGRWVLQKRLRVVASPDIDGLLCALMGSHFLNWELAGFYNGRHMVFFKSTTLLLKEMVFLDIEICHPEIRSLGNHLLLPGHNWHWLHPRFYRTLNPNLQRGITREEFRRRYPFGAFHYLLSLFLAGGVPVSAEHIPTALMLYPDSSLLNLLNYPDNCKDWLRWLIGDPPVPEVQEGVVNRLAGLPLSGLVREMRHWLEALESRLGITPGPRGAQRALDPTTEKGWQRLRELWQMLQEQTGWTGQAIPSTWSGLQAMRTPVESARRKEEFIRFESLCRKGWILSLALTESNPYQAQFTQLPDALLPQWRMDNP